MTDPVASTRLTVSCLMVLLLLAIPASTLQEGSPAQRSPALLAQTFPPESYDFVVELGANDWDYVLSYGTGGDGLFGVFDVVPVGSPIDFFICDGDSLLEWIEGNTSIERHTVYEDRDFAYWEFLVPYEALWYYVFINDAAQAVDVWVQESFDTEAPSISFSQSSYMDYPSPVEVEIRFSELPFNLSYCSVELYGEPLEEMRWDPEDTPASYTFSDTFTLEDLQGTSGLLNLTGLAIDTIGNERYASCRFYIIEAESTTPCMSTSTTTRTPSEPNYFMLVLIGSIGAICCIIANAGKRYRRD